jgi:hypothetical protein
VDKRYLEQNAKTMSFSGGEITVVRTDGSKATGEEALKIQVQQLMQEKFDKEREVQALKD